MSTPCAVFMQSGVSRELFDQWADNPRNGLIIADFAVAGTMARQVLDSPVDILTRAGLKVRGRNGRNFTSVAPSW